jgi:putative endonuclease
LPRRDGSPKGIPSGSDINCDGLVTLYFLTGNLKTSFYLIYFMPFYAYVLKSISTARKYYGSCADLSKRLDKHNRKLVKSTKAYAPYVVIYFESFPKRGEAQKREYFFKSIDGYIFLKQKGII